MTVPGTIENIERTAQVYAGLTETPIDYFRKRACTQPSAMRLPT